MASRKYLPSILTGLIVSSLIFLLAVFYQIGAPTESSRWTYEISTIKSRIASPIKTPKLVVVSGSNALFGISCQMIQQEIGFPCVNGATYAGLGIEYILDRARSLVKPGDFVLLPLEYESYIEDGKLSSSLIDYVFARDNNYLKSVGLIKQIRFLSGISFSRLQTGILAKYRTPARWQDYYKSENLNQYGDETGNRESGMRRKEYKALNSLQPIQDLQGYISSTYGMKVIQDFVNWSNANQIKIIATWPNMLWFDVYQQDTYQTFFKSLEDFYHEIKVPIVGKPRDFMYDKSLFYDTIYHLNDRGVRYRTRQIINLLKPILEREMNRFKIQSTNQ